MSYYRLLQVDIIQTNQLYLGGGINAPLPSSGNALFADGSGGTYWSTGSGGTVGNATLTSAIDGLGTLNYISSSQLISTIDGLGNIFISTGTPGYGDVRFYQLISTTEGLGNLYLSTANLGQIFSTQLISTTDGLGQLYLSTSALLSTVQGLGNLGYLSTPALTSTFAGLGNIYQSSPDVVLARYITAGVSTNFLQTNILNSVTETTNTLYTGTIFASTSITAQNANLLLSYTTTTVPSYPIYITGPASSALSIRLASGANNVATLSVDGANNTVLTSEVPNISKNPILLNASFVQTNALSNIFSPTAVVSPNNTQIFGSTLSTSIIQANQGLFSSLIGDGSQLVNLSFVSTATMVSTIAGSLLTLNVVSTPTLQSTILGLPLYLGYLSSAGLGPVASTALVTTSSLVVGSQIQAASIFMSTTIGASNLWVAAGAAATPLATLEVSADGINWANASSGGFSVQANGVAWNGYQWVAVGIDASTANNIQYSRDGRNWVAASGSQFSSKGTAAAWNGRIWVAVGTDATLNNTLKYSFNGITWINSSGTGFTGGGNQVAWNGSLWVAVGTDTTNAVRYSTDGINWQSGSGSYPTTQNTVAWNGSYWLLGGLVTSAGNGVFYSKVGITWSSVNAPFQSSVYNLTWNGTLWVASSVEGTATYSRYSYDGYTWVTGSGALFSSGGLTAGWSGTLWVQGGQDATQTALLKYSANGISWANSATNNFISVNSVAFSVNLTPNYQQTNFSILPQNNPSFLTSTNTFFFTPTATVINNTLRIDNSTEFVGINCNAPSYELDVYGSANVSSVIYASSFVGDGTRITGLNYLSGNSLISSLDGLGSMGYISTSAATQISLTSSLIGLGTFGYASSLDKTLASTTAGIFNRVYFISSVYASTNISTIVAWTLTVSSINTSSLFASTGIFSSLLTSSFTTTTAVMQQAIVSSIQFYQGPGIFQMTDLQTYNLSTVQFWTNSISTNTVVTSNIYLGQNAAQTPIQFYGRGNFNMTALAEQSTSATSQEFLIFKGSTTNDQVRIQTTGIFVLETGASVRTWPNVSQLPIANAAMIVDATCNVTMNNGTFYLQAATQRVGINCNAPGVTLDVNGLIRGNGSLLTALPALSTPPFFLSTTAVVASSINVSTAIIDRQFVSSILTSTIVTSNISTLILQANQVSVSSITAYSFYATALSANTFYANTGYFSTFIVSSLSTSFLNAPAIITSSIQFFQGPGSLQFPDLQTSNLSTVQLWTNSISTNTVVTSNMYLGQNAAQTPIQFYGRGNFNMTALAEQSTSATSQEFLIFKGSTTNDQIRLQTTGIFVLETGASVRTWPNTAQLPIANAALVVDATCNVTMNNGTFYLQAANQRVGINTLTPFVTLDVNGTVRAPVSLFSSVNTSSITGITAYLSTLTLSSIAMLNGSTIYSQLDNTNTLNASTLNGTTLKISTATVSSLLTTSSITATFGYFSSLYVTALSSLYISTGTLVATQTVASSILTSSLTTTVLTTQTLGLSSLNFYSGDGFFKINDLQTSNVSSIAMYTSSITGTAGLFAFAVGVNCNAPLYNTDINGSANISSLTRVNIGFQTTLQSRWIAVGGGGTNSLAYSADGITWTGIPGPHTIGNAIAWNGIRWVSVGTGGVYAIAYSSDGIKWTGIPVSANTFTTSGRGVAWNGVLWVAVGGGTNSIAYSPDGINWAGIASSGTTNFATNGSGIAWNGIRWVAVGTGTNSIAYSPDGINWTPIASSSANFVTGGNGIAWNGIRWVAVGAGTNSIAYSSDGISWIPIASSAANFATAGYGVAWNGIRWVAVGQGTNSIAYSFDGITWTGIVGPFATSGAAIAWNGVRWVAAGSGTNTLAYSSDGVTWTGVAASAQNNFTTFGVGVAWSSNIVPSYTQQTLDILPSQTGGIPFFFRSTNQIFLAQSSMVLNATLSVDMMYNRVGVNNNIPQFSFDVNGNARISSLTIGDTGTGVITSTNTTFQLAVWGVNGPARVGGTTWTQISDQRMKENIVDADLDKCYADIKAVPLRRFTYTSTFFETVPLPDRNVLGFIAQEVKQLQPKAITVADGFGISDLNWLNIDQMNMSLYGAVKRMMQTNEELTSSVAGLQTTVQYCMSTVAWRSGGNV